MLIAAGKRNHLCAIRIAREREQMVEQRYAVSPSEPKACGRGRYALRDRARIVEHAVDDFRCDLSHALGLDMIVE